MPHDVNGRELKVGDRVFVPAVVKSLSPGEDYCNVELETVHGRRPDGAKEVIHAINTGVVLADAGEEVGDGSQSG